MVLQCLKCWLHFLRWLNYSSALGRADLSSGSWHLVEWLQQRGLLHLPPPKSAEVLPLPVRWPRSFSNINILCQIPCITFDISQIRIKCLDQDKALFFMEVTPQPALCLSERNKTASYKSREKNPFLLKFHLPESGFLLHKALHKSGMLSLWSLHPLSTTYTPVALLT